jgi:hypothetical protein
MVIGILPNQAYDVFRIFHNKKKDVNKSRDIIWLNKSYGS